MRAHRSLLLLAVAAMTVSLVGSGLASAAPRATTTTSSQLLAGFKKATGYKLVRNRQLSYAGHYVAYDLGVSSGSKRALFGTFTVYLVTSTDVESDVTDLLSDTHTGVLGTPGPGNIYWEQGTTLQGVPYWQAKRRYGQNVVVKWIGASPVKKTDSSWKRLHKALTAATS